jgi:hypothetical protein
MQLISKGSNAGFRTLAAGAGLATILLAACSGSGTVPNTAGGIVSPMQATVGSLSRGPSAECGGLPHCIGIKPGYHRSGPIEVKCDPGHTIADCGSVTWKAKGLPTGIGVTISFNPNPGDPTTQTVTASKTAKKGTYPYHYEVCVTKPQNGCGLLPDVFRIRVI